MHLVIFTENVAACNTCAKFSFFSVDCSYMNFSTSVHVVRPYAQEDNLPFVLKMETVFLNYPV